MLTVARRSGAPPGEVGPLEVLRGAMAAIKANGQPDWSTRLSAARTLAALRPDEVKPKTDETGEPSIVVYDLPPGTNPVLHRPRDVQENAPVVNAEPSPDTAHEASGIHWFTYKPEDGEDEAIGSWSSDPGDQSGVVNLVFHPTEDAETAAIWRSELAAGRLPDQQ